MLQYAVGGRDTAEQHHCYLFHQLYDHTHLAWQDIIEIDEVWMEVNVDFQNVSKL